MQLGRARLGLETKAMETYIEDSLAVHPSFCLPHRRRILHCGEEGHNTACASTTRVSTTSRWRPTNRYHSSPQPSRCFKGSPCSPSWTYGKPTTWCGYGKGTSGRLHSTQAEVTMSIWSCHLALPTPLLWSRLWLTLPTLNILGRFFKN